MMTRDTYSSNTMGRLEQIRNAAPDLLAALEYMVTAQLQPFDHADRRACMDQARTAIEKARQNGGPNDDRTL